MRRDLNEKAGLQLNEVMAPTEVVDVYNMYLSSTATSSRDTIHLDIASKQIKFPLFLSQFLNNNEKFTRLGECFKLVDGGRFIADPKTVPDQLIPSVLRIFTSLLEYNYVDIPKMMMFLLAKMSICQLYF